MVEAIHFVRGEYGGEGVKGLPREQGALVRACAVQNVYSIYY